MATALNPLRSPATFLARLALLLSLSFAMALQPAAAQSLLRDAETETLLLDMSRPLIEAAGLRPDDVKVMLIGDRSINAFVAGGQIVYINSGLIEEAESANEVQGVIAHELGHVTGGHIIRLQDGVEVASKVMLVTLLLGTVAAALGGGEAAAGLMGLGQQAATGKFFQFVSTQESSADQAGASFLRKAGISGKGSLSFFKKLQNMEMRYSAPQDEGYFRTHPLSSTRIATLETAYKADPAWDKPTNPGLEARFQRVKAKLFGFVADPKTTLSKFPETNRSVPARYARAFAWHKSSYPDRAMAEVDSLLKEQPEDPYLLELKGQILLEGGKPQQALDSLRKSVALAPDQPLISAMFGHALIATENRAHFNEARQVLRSAIGRDNSNPFAWYQLGIVYDREGDTARAALATAERYNLIGKPKLALTNAEVAMRGITRGTPDWIRAQDIAMVSRTEVEKDKKGRR